MKVAKPVWIKEDSLLEKAFFIANEAHCWQKRRSGEPYIIHPLATVDILRKNEFEEDVLVCAVLHDLCEDTLVSNLEIKDIFWERVGFVVNAISKNKENKVNNEEELKEDYQRMKKEKINNDINTFQEYLNYNFEMYLTRLYVGMLADPWIMFVKMADQIHNLSTLKHVPDNKRCRKIEEVEKHFLPLYEEQADRFIESKAYASKYLDMKSLLIKTINSAKTEFNIDTSKEKGFSVSEYINPEK